MARLPARVRSTPEAVVVRQMSAETEAPEPDPVPPAPPTSAPAFGMIAVSPGFVPDPMTVDGQSGGPDDATARDVSCVGFIASSPSHILTLRGGFAWLRVMVRSNGDTTLVIRAPDGTMLCNDDFEGVDPAVEGAFVAGDYEVWVGSYERSMRHDYVFGLTELPSTTPSTLAP